MQVTELMEQNIVQSQAEWLLYAGVKDMSPVQQVAFLKEYPGIEEERTKLYAITKADGTKAWVPGSLKANTTSFAKKILFCCVNENPHSAASYKNVRDVYDKLANNHQKLGIKNVAVPLIGCGYGLQGEVVMSYIGLAFQNKVDQLDQSDLNVTAYRY